MIKIRDLAFEYFDRDEEGNLTEMIHAIRGICFDAQKGEFIAVAGKNGSGKSTFAKILNRLLVPVEGTVLIGGLDAMDEENILDIRKKVGMVFQNPDDQLIGSVISEDVAFGAENIGAEQLWQRVISAVQTVGLMVKNEDAKIMKKPLYKKGEHPLDRRINELSGGEKQKVAIAGVLAMNPACIVLDEATSMLDAQSRSELLQTVRELNQRMGITVIMITHIMDELLLADRIYVMHQGKVVMQGRREAIFRTVCRVGRQSMESGIPRLEQYGLEYPEIVRIAKRLHEADIIRTEALFSVEALAERIRKEYPYAFMRDCRMQEIEPHHCKINPRNAILFHEISFSYGGKEVLHDINLSVAKGEYVAVIGATGSGKSTLLQLIPRLLVPKTGEIYVDGIDVNDRSTDIRELRCKIGYVFQYPEQQMFAKNVYEDVVFGPRNIGVSEVEAEKRAYESIALVGLPEEVYDMPISKLSGGQKRRVALAGVLAMKPQYLILDEPVAGLDPEGKQEMLEIIDMLHREGITIIMVSHDVESVARYAERVLVLEEGRLIGEGTPAEAFYGLRERPARLPAIMQLLVLLRMHGLPVDCLTVDMERGIANIAYALEAYRKGRV